MSWANPSSINLSNGDVQKNAARKLLNLPTWESYRKLAYGGVDGTGSLSIMFGQYLDAFAFNHSQSNKNLVVNTSILSGMKWLNFFRVEYQFDRSYLWDEDGTPTRGLLEWGELIDRVHAIDDQLTRLNNDWIMFKVGQIGSEDGASASGFHRGNFDSEQSAAKNREFGLSAVQVQSLSKAHGLHAIYEVKMERTELDPGWVNTITVNDNTMGSGLFRFDYDGLWSYRETETNGSSMTQYPLENDGHFSNWSGARATFTFYGNKVELLLRADQAGNIRAAITKEGEDPQWKTGSGRSLVFDNLEQGVHTLTIENLNDSQAGIDGAKVSYQGRLPADITAQNSTGANAVQEYLDQRTTDASAKNHFAYQPESVASKPMGTDNNGFKPDGDEVNGWVQHVQNAQYQNLGFTRTTKEDASYSIQFYGTGVQLYAGVTPLGEADPSAQYGTLTFQLDGKDVQPTQLDAAKLGNNGKVSARMWAVSVPEAKQNENHLLTVSVKGGYSRIDYAVVERMWENEPGAESFSVSVAASENGKAELLTADRVTAGGSAVVKITPNEGYQVYRIVVNGVAQNIPEGGRLVLTNIQENKNIQITFAPAAYPIQLAPGEGGVIVPSALKTQAAR